MANVVLNEKGLCKDCDEYKKGEKYRKVAKRYVEANFKHILKKARENPRFYDAMILFSGGKDSSYLLKVVKEEFKLRPLAFSVVHPLVSEVALKNMEDIADKIGVDLVKVFAQPSIYKKVMKYGLLHSAKYDLGEFAGCSICSYNFYWISVQYARKMDIPIIFTGDDLVQNNGVARLSLGDEVIKKCKQGIKPLGRVHDLYMDALGPDYKGSIYDCNTDELSSGNYPTIISPFTFLKQDYDDYFKTIDSLGLDSKKYNKLITNCSAVPLFAYISLKKFDCVPYIRHYASELRIGKPYLTQYLLNTNQNVEQLTKELTEDLLQEYKSLVFYIVENK